MNKKLITISVMSIFCITSAFAQSEDRRENIEFGVKAGINQSNVWDAQGEDFVAEGKTGFAGGIYLGIPITTLIGIQPEILFSQKGFQGSGTLLGFPYSFSRTTNYVDIPLQIQIKPVDFVTVLAGPQFSYLLDEKNVYTFGGNSTDQEQQFENDNIRKNVLGFVVGGDVIAQSLVISARAGWDFQTNNGDGTSSTPRYKNRWLQLTVGFKI